LKIIFIVDDNNVNLLSADEALSKHYRVFTMPSALNMFDLLEDIMPDLILLDILMPVMNGFETLKKLKASKKYTNIPVIFVTSRNDVTTESLGFELGAVDFISKPFSAPVLLNRIKTHLEIEYIIHEQTDRLMKLKNGIVSVLANMVENRDILTGKHIERTSIYLELLFKAMLKHKVYFNEISEWDFNLIVSSARLHDIGKISITDLILNKPEKLSEDEYDAIKTHVREGEEIISNIIAESGDETYLQYAKLFAGYHHERWDGTGYPYGLKGLEIPLQGRIMALVDVYDALVSERSYKQSISHDKAVEIIKNNSGSHFDPEIVRVFLLCENEFETVSVE